ncbi:SLBB domain-containing protein [Candidatus Woesebacteria bacterium]|nr:SLBB domain-containing protein [Candidatus Woesebacteria bacterium]
MSTVETNLLDKFRLIYEKQEHKRFISFVREARVPLLIFAICMAVGIYFSYQSILLVMASGKNTADYIPPDEKKTRAEEVSPKAKIYVDLSGSVEKPQTYEVDQGTRLFRLIEMAGGLSAQADKPYIQRNYNFSVILQDQQKVHIPSVYEVRDGYFTEKHRLVTLDMNTTSIGKPVDQASDGSLISLNESSLEVLKSLSGVGDVTAQRIIAGRPYDQVQDVVDREIIKQSLYDKIVNRLEL